MNRRAVLYPAMGLGLLAIWLFLGFLPQQRERQQVQTQIETANWEVADFDRIVGDLPKYMKTYKDVSLKRSHLNSSLYAKQDILDLFGQLGTAAAARNLRLVEISPPVDELLALNRANPGSNDPQFLNITMGLRGNYLDFGHFVDDLERAAYFKGINTCYVRGQQEATPEVDCTVSFRALIKTASEAS